MSLNKLRLLARSLGGRNFLQRVITGQPRVTIKTQATDDEDAPIKYSTSPASQWKAEYSQRGVPSDTPEYEALIIIASVSSFLLYFLWLRESNDIDEIFEMELGDHFPEMADLYKEKLKQYQIYSPSAPKM